MFYEWSASWEFNALILRTSSVSYSQVDMSPAGDKVVHGALLI